MIKVNELRIGNFVYNQFNTQIQIESISNFGVNLKVVDLPNEYLKETLLDEIKPIPLTEEWLLRFRFKKRSETNEDDDDFVWIYELAVKINNIEISFGKYKDELQTFLWSGDCLYHIKYVHQLQNLYFALTGEEITFKTKL